MADPVRNGPGSQRRIPSARSGVIGDWSISVVGVIVSSVHPTGCMNAEAAGTFAALPPQSERDEAATRRLAGFLAVLSGVWAVALPEERNRITRKVFDGVLIEGRSAVAIRLRTELRAFYELAGGAKNTDAAPESPRSGISVTRWAEATGVAHAESHFPAGAIRIAYSR